MATNAFQAGFNLRNKKDDDTGTSGPASAFQAGFAQGNQKFQKMKQARNTLKTAKGSNTSGLSTTPIEATAMIPSMKKGGRVKRTGLVFMHRGERVIPAKQSRKKASSGKQRTITKP